MNFKEHDVVKLTAEDYEFITTPNEEEHDEFEILPKGTIGTIVTPPVEEQGGCNVEFPYINEKYPDADPVVWVLFTEIESSK